MQRLALEFTLRALLIAAAAGAVLAVLRIRAAAAQHAVWTGVVAAMLLLPFWIAWGPKASLPVLPSPGGQAVIPEAGPVIDATPAAPPERPHSAPQSPPWNWSAFGLGVYVLGAGALLLRLAIGMIGASRLTPAWCVAPVTVGVLRPRIILPESCRDWPQAQLDAVLAHERAHARRRDPLVQWLALLNRALFWFHPLAWWLERRLAALAEEACDAAVLEQGHDPRQYSGYLLDLARAVERAGMRVNATVAAMPGSHLPQRIRNLVAGQMPIRVSPTRMVCAGVVCTLASALFAAGSLDRLPPIQLPPLLPPAAHPPGPEAIPARRLLAQAAVPEAPVQSAPAAAPSPRFEVASVKAATPLGPRGMQGDAGGGPGTNDPGTWHCHNCPVFWVLSGAYDVELYEYAGPGWVHQVRFDFDAKVPPGTTPAAFQSMQQNLLADRFKLAAHRETRDLPAYELTVMRNGPKFQEGVPPEDSKVDDGPAFRLKTDKDGFPILPPGMSMAVRPGHAGIRSNNQPMAWFAHMLSQQLQGPVVDATGLKAKYDFTVSWAFKDGVSADPVAESEFQPALVEAVQSQLGLRLTKKKLPVEVLVIDHLEKTPTEN